MMGDEAGANYNGITRTMARFSFRFIYFFTDTVKLVLS